MKLNGSCLCGSVSISAENASEHVGACHCGMCRKWGGGPLMAVDCGVDVNITPESGIGTYDSSPWAERGFCQQCGSHLFYRIKSTGQHMIPAGLFDDAPAFNFSHQVFIDQKPEFYAFENATSNMTEAEIFAKYAPEN